MTNSTETFWDVDGVSLQTMAFDIETLGGDRLTPPGLRGANITVPYAPGDVWMPKQVASRSISLDMWVIGVNEDGSIPTGDQRRVWENNFRKLRQLLWTPNRQITLTKRFYVDGVLKTASAQAQFAGGISPDMNGQSRGSFTVTLMLADPYFYSAAVSTTLTTGSQTVTVEGDDITRAITLHFAGARKYPKVHNSTLNVDVELHEDLSSGDVADLDVKAFTSVTDPSAIAPFNSVGDIVHTGSPLWLLLQPGDNTIVVSSDSGIGAVTMHHQAAWL